MKKKLFLVLVFLSVACGGNDTPKTITIHWEDFPKTYELKGGEVNLSELPSHWGCAF